MVVIIKPSVRAEHCRDGARELNAHRYPLHQGPKNDAWYHDERRNHDREYYSRGLGEFAVGWECRVGAALSICGWMGGLDIQGRRRDMTERRPQGTDGERLGVDIGSLERA